MGKRGSQRSRRSPGSRGAGRAHRAGSRRSAVSSRWLVRASMARVASGPFGAPKWRSRGIIRDAGRSSKPQAWGSLPRAECRLFTQAVSCARELEHPGALPSVSTAVQTEPDSPRCAAGGAVRVAADGKFLARRRRAIPRQGRDVRHVRARRRRLPVPLAAQIAEDFRLMAGLGINTVRTYTPPRRDLLDEAARHGLRVMVGLPWSQHVAFLDDRRLTRSHPPRRSSAGARARRSSRRC